MRRDTSAPHRIFVSGSARLACQTTVRRITTDAGTKRRLTKRPRVGREASCSSRRSEFFFFFEGLKGKKRGQLPKGDPRNAKGEKKERRGDTRYAIVCVSACVALAPYYCCFVCRLSRPSFPPPPPFSPLHRSRAVCPRVPPSTPPPAATLRSFRRRQCHLYARVLRDRGRNVLRRSRPFRHVQK